MLTQRNIQTLLQVGNCCGAKKVNTYIENLKKNKYCPEILAEANILFGHIDSLKCYKLFHETDILETYTFAIEGSAVTTLQAWLDTVDDEPRTIVFFATSGLQNAFGGYAGTPTITDYLDFVQHGINDNVDPSTDDPLVAPYIFGYTMSYELVGGSYVITLTAKSCDTYFTSGTKWGFDILNVGLDETIPYSKAMSGTTACAYPYEDCITYEQVLNILAAIKRICNGPCTDYVNFQLN